ncbi:DUF697 domain-containing protein [Aestuariirhabdus sp. LZHN29]|uniref:DUF697 domain-containing protein n=1 Tax=Aestuariirhabdus sp. LZHN29 TaxID=3417462 RepID=UPI003CF74AB8
MIPVFSSSEGRAVIVGCCPSERNYLQRLASGVGRRWGGQRVKDIELIGSGQRMIKRTGKEIYRALDRGHDRNQHEMSVRRLELFYQDGQGMAAGVLTGRLGLQAMKLCRPLPFIDDEEPAMANIRRQLLTQSGQLFQKPERRVDGVKTEVEHRDGH